MGYSIINISSQVHWAANTASLFLDTQRHFTVFTPPSKFNTKKVDNNTNIF